MYGKMRKKVWAVILVATFLTAALPAAALEVGPVTIGSVSWLDLGALVDLIVEWLPAEAKKTSGVDSTTQSEDDPPIEPPTEEMVQQVDPLG